MSQMRPGRSERPPRVAQSTSFLYSNEGHGNLLRSHPIEANMTGKRTALRQTDLYMEKPCTSVKITTKLLGSQIPRVRLYGESAWRKNLPLILEPSVLIRLGVRREPLRCKRVTYLLC